MLNVLGCSVEFMVIVWVGSAIAEAEGRGLDPIKLV